MKRDDRLKDIDNLKILSKIELSLDEENIIKEDIDKIITYIKDISKVDTKGVEPMTHFEEVKDVYRDDKVENEDFSSNLLKNAPKSVDDYIIVPKTIN